MQCVPASLTATLKDFRQQHVLQWWQELSADQQQQLCEQLRNIDFALIDRKWKASTKADDSAEVRVSRADMAMAPSAVVRQCSTKEGIDIRQQAEAVGVGLLAAGKVAVITVAGGQGSRLGFDYPKGMFPIGPISDRSLFQIFAEQIDARRQRHGGSVPWMVMTSSSTHQQTVEFFADKHFFGLDESSVMFFQQGSMPAVDAQTGQLLMDDRGSLSLSPDGHGGLVTALRRSGLIDRLRIAGAEHLFYHQVDNPTIIMCDPVLLGLHHQHASELTTNVVRKQNPAERMGVLVDVQGRLEIIEYSELTEAQSARTNAQGEWIFWAGNTAIHVFRREFLERLTADGCQLELHLAHKAVPYLGRDGRRVEPAEPNAFKFERFIFDALPLARNALIVEGDRDREFNPVKNSTGKDSPETARAALNRISREWLGLAGHSIDPSTSVEISPRIAMNAEELAARLADGSVTVADLLSVT